MFSLTAEYALRAVVFLAEGGNGRYTTQAIADATQIPPRYLAKILQKLAQAGVLKGQRGLNGGFCLARGAAQITALDVVQAVEPIRRIHTCPLGLEAHQSRLCPLHTRLDEALAQIEQNLRKSSIVELLSPSTFRTGDGGTASGSSR